MRPDLRARSTGTFPTVERQTGIAISYEKQGEPFPVDGGAGFTSTAFCRKH